jgi:hypothetical protein
VRCLVRAFVYGERWRLAADGQLVEVAFLLDAGADRTVFNFSVIYDYPNQVIALLALPHSYEIKSSS